MEYNSKIGRVKDFVQMFGLDETIDQLAVTNSVCQYCCVEDGGCGGYYSLGL